MGVTSPVLRRDVRPKPAGRTGDRMLLGLCVLAGLIVAVTLVDIGYQLVNNSRPAIDNFGLAFLGHETWAPNFRRFGAADMIFGTAVSSTIAIAIAAPLGLAIAVYLSMIAPKRVRAIVGPLVEMLAAVPSIIYGFWGIAVLAPFIQKLEPGLHSTLGFIPLFGAPQTTGIGMLTAGLVLTLMILPIMSALSRDVFLTVPGELREGAEALGATRWEVIRGVVLPSTISGVTAATVLALTRALGEAIAVSLVIGDASGIHANLFLPGASLAERIANQFPSAENSLHTASMFYCGLILLVICLLTSLAARAIAGRFDVERRYARAATA
jgi:phosphate transport system permease protein